jgi:class 3 adenylate cyclase
VNLSQRLQQVAAAGETVVSEATLQALSRPVDTVPLGAQMVKGRDTPVTAYKLTHLAGGPVAGGPVAGGPAAGARPNEMTTRTGA